MWRLKCSSSVVEPSPSSTGSCTRRVGVENPTLHRWARKAKPDNSPLLVSQTFMMWCMRTIISLDTPSWKSSMRHTLSPKPNEFCILHATVLSWLWTLKSKLYLGEALKYWVPETQGRPCLAFHCQIFPMKIFYSIQGVFKMSNICNQSGKIQVTMMLWERSLNDRQPTSPSRVKQDTVPTFQQNPFSTHCCSQEAQGQVVVSKPVPPNTKPTAHALRQILLPHKCVQILTIVQTTISSQV